VSAIEQAGSRLGTVPALEVESLCTEFRTESGLARAVDNVSLTVGEARTLAIVGESGSGKSATCLSIMGLLQGPDVTISGDVRLFGRSILGLRPRQLRSLRGVDMAMVFQDPMTSLNPAYRIGTQLVEAVRLHSSTSRRAARARALDALKEVGIPDAAERIDDFPHQFSGGMRQRVMIAMALINEPKLLIADEPTTALDVTTQTQILKLIGRLQQRHHMSIIFVTHDLGVVAQIADEVAVMYAGQIVDYGPALELFSAPRHPYTAGLLAAIPRTHGPMVRLAQIPGTPPSPTAFPSGCRFHPRCNHRMPICAADPPPFSWVDDDQTRGEACHLDDAVKAHLGDRTMNVSAGEQ
jgi:oligopeptide/dipeptide ABC transporter ATP-binding protein